MPLPDPEVQSPLAWDLMWADPARESDVNEENQHHLFLENTRRKTSCLFTENALKAFLKNTGYHYGTDVFGNPIIAPALSNGSTQVNYPSLGRILRPKLAKLLTT